MQAGDIRKIIWAHIRDCDSATMEELMAACVEAGATSKNLEQQVIGSLRKLQVSELITEQTDSNNQRFFVLSKKGQREARKETRKLEAPERGDLYEAVTKIRLTTISLSGSIPNESAEQGRLEWPRDHEGNVVLFPVWWKALWRKTFERVGSIPYYVAYWLDFDSVSLPIQTDWIKIPVPPSKPGQGGQGVNVIEVLPAGTEIIVRGMYPGMAVARESLEALWRIAGRVGFSPGKSKLGYGTFEVVECRIMPALFPEVDVQESSGVSAH